MAEAIVFFRTFPMYTSYFHHSDIPNKRHLVSQGVSEVYVLISCSFCKTIPFFQGFHVLKSVGKYIL